MVHSEQAAVAWQWGGQGAQSTGGPHECRERERVYLPSTLTMIIHSGRPSSRQKVFFDNIPVSVTNRRSGYQTLECFAATLPTQGVYGRLVPVGCEFHKNAFGDRDPLGEQ